MLYRFQPGLDIGKLPDSRPHDTLPACAFPITYVTVVLPFCSTNAKGRCRSDRGYSEEISPESPRGGTGSDSPFAKTNIRRNSSAEPIPC